ncbi:hypothetical protein [Crossiella sp. CA198]|uniref:hypothetical protein n=1 Tax=Crossiella sp. CA198 TaxID=3455607 RepID=UPI003F8CF6DB
MSIRIYRLLVALFSFMLIASIGGPAGAAAVNPGPLEKVCDSKVDVDPEADFKKVWVKQCLETDGHYMEVSAEVQCKYDRDDWTTCGKGKVTIYTLEKSGVETRKQEIDQGFPYLGPGEYRIRSTVDVRGEGTSSSGAYYVIEVASKWDVSWSLVGSKSPFVDVQIGDAHPDNWERDGIQFSLTNGYGTAKHVGLEIPESAGFKFVAKDDRCAMNEADFMFRCDGGMLEPGKSVSVTVGLEFKDGFLPGYGSIGDEGCEGSPFSFGSSLIDDESKHAQDTDGFQPYCLIGDA